MGREVKRVALDFVHPLREGWPGFVNPHYRECPADCRGGYSAEYLLLERGVGAAIRHASPAGIALGTALTGRPPSLGPFGGYDSTASYAATVKILDAVGLPHKCPTCDGEGIDPAVREAYEAWTQTEPPEGDGWQMWETTSEGSPISPVFDTPEGLARWLADTGASTFGRSTADYETWLRMIRSGWAPSAVLTGGVMMSGVDAIAADTKRP